MELEQGMALGPYVIEEAVGAGAMGEVYRARDPRLGREVAVKVLPASKACEPERLRRFEQEARAAAALTHPNIVTVYDVGTHGDLPFLVTEMLSGKTLRQHLDDGPIEPRRVVELGAQFARGVAAAHAVRIIHRDLKPDNLFLTRDGTVKILDFGLAKLRPQAFTGPDASTLDQSEPGRLLGTLSYMAPEQLRGQPLDARADLFSAGAVLYEMLTGRSPFRRETAADTVAAILGETPAPMGTGNAALESLILHCLEKDPGDRFQSSADLVLALETALERPPGTPAREESRPPSSIAVLPFTDMSPTRDQDFLCDGLADELINRLTRIEGLCIAARSSSFQFRESVDVRAIGQRLGVGTVVEGSVRKIGDRLRVNVQLVDVADGYQRWSERYDRKVEDVFAIQDEIAESVATALRGVLSVQEKDALRNPETAVETYEYFLRGRQLMHRFNRPSIEGGLQMFERALETDPGYAPAWAGLAQAGGLLYEWWGGDKAHLEGADRASSKALELAPQLAESHAARGFALSLLGRHDDAGAEYEEALRINPNHFDALYSYGRASFANGEIERSAGLFRRAAAARREDFQSPILLSQSLQMLGRSEEARQAGLEGARRAEQFLELNPTDARALSLGANVLVEIGQPERALCWTERAVELYPQDFAVMINAACVYCKLGRKEQALDILEDVAARGGGKRKWLENDPDYDSLRDDPRFQTLLHKLS